MCLAVRPAPVRASDTIPLASSGLPTYHLTIDNNGLSSPGLDFNHVNANVPLPQVEAIIFPPGAVAAPSLSDGKRGLPLTILPDSHGFHQDRFVVFLQDPKNKANPPLEQRLGMAFFGDGVAPGGSLHFALNTDKVLKDPPTLVSLTPGVTISPDNVATSPPPPCSAAPTSSSVVPVPEPVSPALWSALAGFVLIRSWSARRPAVGERGSKQQMHQHVDGRSRTIPGCQAQVFVSRHQLLPLDATEVLPPR